MFQRQHLIVQITRHLLSLIVLMMIENTKKLKFGDKMQHKFGLERNKFVKFNFKLIMENNKCRNSGIQIFH